MNKEINLIGYLPLYVQEYREIKGVMNAEEPELHLVKDTSEAIKDNMFVLYTNEEGVKRYEKMFGLTSSENDTLNNRQARVLAQYTNTVIYTLRGLIERLNILCGVDNYTLQFVPNEYSIAIELYPRVENLISTIKSMLVDMIPANMLWTCVVKCNRHGMLTKYPIYLLEQFTHQEMYDETIDDHISATCENIANYTVESLESIHCEHILNFGMRKV